MILSVLCDHTLPPHPEQSVRLENKQPALTVGCLVKKLRIDALLDIIQTVVESENPQGKFKELTKYLEDYRTMKISNKHMVGRKLGRLMPTASPKYRLPEIKH